MTLLAPHEVRTRRAEGRVKRRSAPRTGEGGEDSGASAISDGVAGASADRAIPPARDVKERAAGGYVLGMSSAAARLVEVSPARSARLLADVEQFNGGGRGDRPSVYDRLAAALGEDFAERIVKALSAEALDRLDSALTPAFADHLAAVLGKELGNAA